MMQILNPALQQAHSKHIESAASPQLRQAANEFEANFLQELLKPLSQDSMFNSGADGASGGSMGTVSSIAAQALADGIAKNGGLGIAKRVLAELAPVESAESHKNELPGGKKCGGCAQHLPLLSADGTSSPESLSPTGLSTPMESPVVGNPLAANSPKLIVLP